MPHSAARRIEVLICLLVCSPTYAQVTQRVSLSSDGVGGNLANKTGFVTPNGRYVSFSSDSTNLVPGDNNGAWDVFLRDRRQGTTELISVDSIGNQGNGQTLGGALSADGRFVVFVSWATNLVPGDTNNSEDVFVRDRLIGTTERVSIGPNGAQANRRCSGGPITPDGRFVLFSSTASNLGVANDSHWEYMYIRDRLQGTTELVSVGQGGVLPFGYCWGGTLSDDGRFVAFVGEASNLVAGDSNGGYPDVFIRDRQAGTTELASVSTTGEQAEIPNLELDDVGAMISGNGRFVAFMESASNLVPGDTNGVLDVFVRDRLTEMTERASVSSQGVQGNGRSGYVRISRDGRYVSFVSNASNLAQQDPNAWASVYVRDRLNGTTEVVDVAWHGGMPNHWMGGFANLSTNGRFVTWDTSAADQVPGPPMPGIRHVYVRDRFRSADFTSLCSPGVDEVRGCPCSNPPAGPDRGCDNSAGTGGAALTASGGTFLTSDGLVFQATQIRLGATCILLQGKALLQSGVEFGQGVRCLGGPFERLYSKFTGDGNLIAPDFHVGDEQVSVRSAARGDPIVPGESRYYLVYYRDPFVVGGCDLWRSFNATQTGQVTWSP